jgi:hypothetical protein
VLGRHGIRIRPWPHLDPVEVMRAHQIMEHVQEEQHRWYGVKELGRCSPSPRPTHARSRRSTSPASSTHSVGILAHTGTTDQLRLNEEDKQNMPLPVHGPACNSSGHLIGWHTFNSLPFSGKTATVVGEAAPVLPRDVEWAGFVLNSRMLWKEADGKPD